MSNRNRVIVRAFGDEPVPLWLSKVVGDRVVVANSEESTTLSLPARSVFEFNATLLDALRAAFKSRDVKRLAHLWASGSSYKEKNFFLIYLKMKSYCYNHFWKVIPSV